MVKKNMGRGESRVAAKIDLRRRRQPPDVEEVSAIDEERSFGETVFLRYLLEEIVRQPLRENTDPGRVTGEEPIRESVHLVVRDLHEEGSLLFRIVSLAGREHAAIRGAHACSVLVVAFRDDELPSPRFKTATARKFANPECVRQHAASVRSPEFAATLKAMKAFFRSVAFVLFATPFVLAAADF